VVLEPLVENTSELHSSRGGADLEDVVVDVVAAASSSSGSCCFVVHGQLLAVVDADAGDGEKQLGVLIWRDRSSCRGNSSIISYICIYVWISLLYSS
jgi:hypothetical protein